MFHLTTPKKQQGVLDLLCQEPANTFYIPSCLFIMYHGGLLENNILETPVHLSQNCIHV